MDWPTLIKWLREELAELKKAKAAVFVLVAVTVAATWWGAGVFYLEHMATLKDGIETGDRRIKELERQLREARSTSATSTTEPSGSVHKLYREPTTPEPAPAIPATVPTPTPPRLAAAPPGELTPEAIWADREAHPPYEQNLSAKKYIGVHVKWTLSFYAIEPQENGKLWEVGFFSLYSEAHDMVISTLVKPGDYPEIKMLARGTPVEVQGRIDRIDEGSITLRDAKLTLPTREH